MEKTLIRERLERGFAILQLIQRRRLEERSPRLGWAIERAIVDRELKELEEGLRPDHALVACRPIQFPATFRPGAGPLKLDILSSEQR